MGNSNSVFLPRDLIRSDAYLDLAKRNSIAIWLIQQFYSRRQVQKVKRGSLAGRQSHIDLNHGQLQFTYSEANKKGITKPRFKRAIDLVVEYGFIDIKHPGGGMLGDSSLYGISDRWKEWGTSEFIKKKRQKDKRGVGFTADNWEERTGKKRRKNKTK
jgi:hypothetical protein